MKHFLLFFVFLTLFRCAYAQDQIVKLNGDEVPARVMEITLEEVLYLHPDSLQGKTRRIPKAEVFMVKFANGTREVFANNLPGEQANEINPQEMYLLGRQDAQQYYKGNGAMWGSAASSVVVGYGLIGPIIIGFVKPRAHNNPVPDPALLSNPDYVRGYEARARSKKTGKVLAGAGIGTATGFVIGIIAVLSALNYQ